MSAYKNLNEKKKLEGLSSLQKLFASGKEAFPGISELIGSISKAEGGFAKLGATAKGVLGIISSHPILSTVAAIAGVTTVLVEMSKAGEKAKEQMDASFSDYEASASEVDSLNSKLDETNSKISELRAKGGLTFVEKDELNKLEQASKELTFQKNIAEEKASNDAKQAAKDAEITYRENFRGLKSTYEITPENIERYRNLDGYGADSEIYQESYDKSNIAAQIVRLQDLKEARDAITDTSSEEWSNYNDQINEVEGNILEKVSTLEDIQSKLSSLPFEDLTGSQKQLLSNVKSQIETAYENLYPETMKQQKLDDIMSSDTFAGAKKSLLDIAKANKGVGLTVEDLNSGYDYLKASLEAAGITAEEFVAAINSEAGVKNYAEIRKQLSEAFADNNDGESPALKLSRLGFQICQYNFSIKKAPNRMVFFWCVVHIIDAPSNVVRYRPDLLHFCPMGRNHSIAAIELAANDSPPDCRIGWFKSDQSCFSKIKGHPKGCPFILEVPARFELADESFADSCLTTWPRYRMK